jgi:DNA-binding NtrC family response regulator
VAWLSHTATRADGNGLDPPQIRCIQGEMSAGESGVETVPEVGGQKESERARPTLLIASFASRGAQAVPVDGCTTLGRGRPSAGHASDRIDLPDKLLSRRHLRIAGRKGGYNVEDLGSLNGSYLDGRRLEKPTSLSSGSILLFGNHAGVFRRVSEAESAALAEEAASPFGPVATLSPALALAVGRLRRLARTDNEVLLVGETGVGKEVYARAIHRASGRAGPFVSINCATLPGELVEGELFGYAPGAQAPGVPAKPGLVEEAEGGTLLLDEIADLLPAFRERIFRLLQERMVAPIGSTGLRRVDVRVLAASSRLGGGNGAHPPRSDLVARLGVEPIRLPPLRERPEDIGPLAAHFAAGAVGAIEPAAFRALSLYDWPLNVRELEKVIKHAVALATDGLLCLAHLPGTAQSALERGAPIAPRRKARPAPARGELESLLRQHHGNVSRVARSLDRKWAVVGRWIARHELRPEQFRQ